MSEEFEHTPRREQRAGAPWGAAAWGGQATGVLPASLRVASAVNVLVTQGLQQS